MRSHAVTFAGSGGETLSARLDAPADGEPIACALFAHCFTCSKNLNAVVNISRALTQERVVVLRFDFTGLGESAGEFAATSFSSNVADLVAAATFIREQGLAPDILVGHSLGGAAVIRAARQIGGVRAVASIGAPFDPWHASHLLEGSHEEIEASGEATVKIGGRPFRVRKQLLDDLRAGNLASDLRELRLPLLVFHSPVDQTVGIENVAQIFQAARHPKSFMTLDRADHLLTDERDSRYVGTVLASWASRYLPHPEPAQTEEELIADSRVVTRTGPGGFRTERARLAEIADRCPVHRTLSANVHVETRLTPPLAWPAEEPSQP